jgi:carbon-monoxide dehydrogenase large subunit
LGDMAMRANPMRGTFEKGAEPGLEAVAYFGPPYGSTGAGSLAMIVDVDTGSMDVVIEKLAIVHDCGTLVNPMLVEGQVLGGLHMGIGNAFYEQLKYDENGQLLSASFMDYLIPQASDMPDKIVMGHVEKPSPLNELGMKGVGEAGAIPTPACFAQAVENALADCNLQITETPLSPSRLYELVTAAQK